MKKYTQLNLILGWLSFVIAAVVYLITIEPTASFWDCGEFIASAYKLQVGHPPGAPFFMLLGRFFTLFAGDNTQLVPIMVNSLSALASAFTILFLFWTITHLAKKMLVKENEITSAQGIAILGAGLVGAMAYTFSDTFWFSAVEGEVYASSSLFTAIVFWAILKWENDFDKPHANRWLILIAYLVGISIGVHLLNLLAIPAIGLVFYFKKYKPSRNGIIMALAISVILLVFIMYGIIQGIVKVASVFELFFVNTLGMPFNSGIYLFLAMLVGSIIFGIHLSHQKQNNKTLNTVVYTLAFTLIGIPLVANGFLAILLIALIAVAVYTFAYKQHAIMNTLLISFGVILIGYSSYAAIFIRSNANPPMDQNNPENVFTLLSYLNREQYGDRPLLYGPYYSAPVLEYNEGKAVYRPDGDKYVITDHKVEIKYDNEFKTIFPRMYSKEQRHINAYKQWAGIKGRKITQNINGETQNLIKPTFSENMRFFFRYQVGYMYFRYFMWNFAGRQNDTQGHFKEEILNGNWISGINFIDSARLGPQDDLPASIKNNWARNRYFMLPLLLGLAGIFIQYRKHKSDFWIVFTLFILTGLAIVVYLNQTPYQPRERDYAYAGSFYAFAIWIGLGVLGLFELISKKIPGNLSASLSVIISLLAVPTLMAIENWDDHDRSGCYTARDFAMNYLSSCDKNGIIFTNGDNDTFPLWYVQDVENFRQDVRVMNLSYLGASWYIDQMHRKHYTSNPVPFSLTPDKYVQGTRDVIYMIERTNKRFDLKKALEFVASDDPRTKQLPGYSEKIDHFPAKKFKLEVDKNQVIRTGTVNEKDSALIVDQLEFNINRSALTKNHLMVLDLLANNNWERPVYFAITVSSDNYLNLEKYFEVNGLAYRIVPIEAPESRMGQGKVNTDDMYDNLMNEYRWGGVDNPDVYLNENNIRMLSNFRNNFSRLAEALYNENKSDSAMQVLDKCSQIIPHERVPYSYYAMPMAETYFKLNAHEKGADIITKAAEAAFENMYYYVSLPPEKFRALDRELQIAQVVIQESMRLANLYNQNELMDKLNSLNSALSVKTNMNYPQ